MSHNREFQRKVAEDRRLVILRFLAEDADYAMNTSLLQTALEAVGHGVSRDLVNADAAWLEESELVHCEDLAEAVSPHGGLTDCDSNSYETDFALPTAVAGSSFLRHNCQRTGIRVVRITQRGLDVARGRAVVPGVKRPGPGY